MSNAKITSAEVAKLAGVSQSAVAEFLLLVHLLPKPQQSALKKLLMI